MIQPHKTADGPVLLKGDNQQWAASLSSVFVELEVEDLDLVAPPRGRLYPMPFGDMTFVRARTTGGAHRVRRSERLIRSSNHTNFFLCFVLAGAAHLTQGGRRSELEAGDLAVLDSTREYAIDIPSRMDSLWITIPRYRLEGRMARLSTRMACKVDGQSGVGHVVSALLRAALAEAPRITAQEANRVANTLLDLLCTAIPDSDDGADTRASTYRSSTMRRIQEFIEARLDDERLNAAAVAQAHGLSVRYLSKLFESQGISISRWIRIRRLERCRADLEARFDRDRLISDIALSHGFRNICHFNRAFRAHFGCAPRVVRPNAARGRLA